MQNKWLTEICSTNSVIVTNNYVSTANIFHKITTDKHQKRPEWKKFYVSDIP